LERLSPTCCAPASLGTRSSSLPSTSGAREANSRVVLVRSTLDINGDWIARRKCLFKRFVEKLINMHTPEDSLCGLFPADMTYEAFFYVQIPCTLSHNPAGEKNWLTLKF
jgi:hypothetical protein